MHLTEVYRARFNLVHYYPSDSVNSSFIPIHAVQNGRLVKKGDQKVLLYGLDVIQERNGTTFPKRLVENINYDYGVKSFAKYEGHLYYSYKGQFLDIADRLNPEVLVQLCVKREELFGLRRGNVDEYKLCLVVSRNLENHKIQKSVEKNYIETLSKKIDVLYTYDIMRLCYNSAVPVPKAKTFDEYREVCNHMNHLLTKVYVG